MKASGGKDDEEVDVLVKEMVSKGYVTVKDDGSLEYESRRAEDSKAIDVIVEDKK